MNMSLLFCAAGLASLLAATGSLVVDEGAISNPDLAQPAEARQQPYLSPPVDLENLLVKTACPAGDFVAPGPQLHMAADGGRGACAHLAGLHFSF